MGLIKRLSAGLFSPKEVYNYRNDKWYVTALFFIFLLLLSILPSTIMILMNKEIDYQQKAEIKRTFTGEDINFRIVDNALVNNGQEDIIVKKVYSDLQVIITTKSDYENALFFAGSSIVIKSDGVYFAEYLIEHQLFTFDRYPILNGLDFNSLKNYNSADWEKVFQVLDSAYLDNKTYFQTSSIVTEATSSLVNILLVSFVLTFLQSFMIARFIRFSKFWKLSIYLLTPYIFGYVLAVLFNVILFYYIGMLISAIYIIILSRSLGKESIWKE